MLPAMEVQHQRKLAAADLRRSAQRLSAAAGRAAPPLLALVEATLSEQLATAPPLQVGTPSKGAMQRRMAARHAAAVWLPTEPELLPDLVDAAIDLCVVLPDTVFEPALDALVAAIRAAEGLELLSVADFADYPSYGGVDLHLRCADAQGPQPKARLRVRTPDEAEALAGLPDLLDSIHQLRPRADRVAQDFGTAEDLEVYYFADLLPEHGFDRERPAGLYCLMTTAEAQVACFWSPEGWRPSAEVEAWIVGAEPGLEPLDGAEAAALLEAWGGRRGAGPVEGLAGQRR